MQTIGIKFRARDNSKSADLCREQREWMLQSEDDNPSGFKFARLGQNFIEFEVVEGIDVVGSLALDTDTSNNRLHNLWAAFNVTQEHCVFKDITYVSNRNSVKPRTLPKDGYLAQTTALRTRPMKAFLFN